MEHSSRMKSTCEIHIPSAHPVAITEPKTLPEDPASPHCPDRSPSRQQTHVPSTAEGLSKCGRAALSPNPAPLL